MPGQQHNQHRVLLGNNPQQIQFPVGMGSGPSLGSGMIRAVQGQHLYQQQQLVHQRFPFSGYVPTGQGTHQPINLMQHPRGLIPQMGIQTQPQPQQPAVVGMRPTTNPMMVYSEQHMPMQTQKKKGRAIKISNPDTNVDVDLHSTGSSALTDRTNVGEQSRFNVVPAEFKSKVTAVSSSTYQPPVNTEPVGGIMSFSQFTPNAIITAPKETIKPVVPSSAGAPTIADVEAPIDFEPSSAVAKITLKVAEIPLKVDSESVQQEKEVEESCVDTQPCVSVPSESLPPSAEDVEKSKDETLATGERSKEADLSPIDASSSEPITDEMDVQRQNIIVNGTIEDESFPMAKDIEQDPTKDSEPFSSILPEPPMVVILPEPPKVITPPIQSENSA